MSLIFLLIFALTQPDNPEKPTGLMIEFIREPSGVEIMDLKPEFTWTVPASYKTQSAFQVLVASSEEKLKKNTGDVWDSGMMEVNNSVEVEYAGEQLKPNTTYCWKVRIWDEKGKATDFSESQSFKTGSTVNYLTTTNKFQSREISPVLFYQTSL